MQLVTIECREVAGRPGVITESGEILDLTAAPTTLAQSQWIPQSVISILAAGEHGRQGVQRLLDAAADTDAETLRAAKVLLPREPTRLMAPVRRPGLVLVQESGAAPDGEPEPMVSIKGPNTVIGPGNTLRVPWRTGAGLSVRPLFGVVLGRPLHLAGPEAAADAIAAYTLLLDLSRPSPGGGASAGSWREYLDSKQFPGACPVGPAFVTADEYPLDATCGLKLSVNGVEMSSSRRELADLPAKLATLSTRFGFRPGDLVGFSLPTAAADQRTYQDGDRICLALDHTMQLAATLSF